MLNKIKNFFMKIMPSKRKIIQLYSALLHNANIKGFITGQIYTGDSKMVCAPGLNCYSCPGAIGACPLGSLQNALSESKTKLPTYILGIILLYSIILGRTICGFLCPLGLLQELLYKIKTPKLKKNKITRVLSYFKYVLLFALVIIIPLMYALQSKNIPLPAFCKYVCPAGTFEGAIFLLSNPNNKDFFSMLGALFTWKFMLLIIFIVASVFIFRFFCRFFCPLGALYGLFNKLSILGVKVDKSKCNHCQACINVCKMDVKEVGDHECIQCGDCINACHCNAISFKQLNKIVKDELEDENISNNEEVIVEKKKDRRISKKTFNIICASVMSAVLIFVLIVVNFPKKKYEINQIASDLSIKLTDNTIIDLANDNNSTLLYFYENLTSDDLEVIQSYSIDKLNIILIASYESKYSIPSQIESKLKELNIRFAKDIKNNKIFKYFSDSDEYSYTVYLDLNDKLLLKSSGLINKDDYENIVMISTLGGIIGNEVGNICYNKKINIIGSDEIFEISKCKGKITVINFWFTTCTPCVLELPHFNSIYEEYKDNINIIAIHEAKQYNSDPDGVKEFVNTQFKDFSIKFGYDDVSNPYYKILGGKEAWPTTIIVDEDGFISFVCHGSLTEAELKSEIEKLL